MADPKMLLWPHASCPAHRIAQKCGVAEGFTVALLQREEESEEVLLISCC